MNTQITPQLRPLARDTYQCDDIPALHRWLEARGYRYYGRHADGEYGRFSCQERHDASERPTYVHSYIQVLANGKIFAPGDHARELLTPLVGDEERERAT